MRNLHYQPELLAYTVGPKQLSDLDKKRVCLIEDCNKIQILLNKGPLTPKDFDKLWDTPMDVLESFVFDQAALLNRHEYEKRIQGADF